MCKKISWKLLSKISKNSFVNRTLIWVVVVPIIAKLFSKLESTLTIHIQEKLYTITLALPFSWSIFYFSAFFFLIGNIIYKISVPIIINDNDSYADFMNEGKGKYELIKYIEKEKLSENGFYDLYDIAPLKEHIKNDYFWQIWGSSNDLYCPSKIIVFILYTIGIFLISIVFIQNLYFVSNYVF